MEDQDKANDSIESEDITPVAEEEARPAKIKKFVFSNDPATEEKMKIRVGDLRGKKYEDMTDEEKAAVDKLRKTIADGLVHISESIQPTLSLISETITASLSRIGKTVLDLKPQFEAISKFMEENEDIFDNIEHWMEEAEKRGVSIDQLAPREAVELIRQWQKIEEEYKPYFTLPSTPATKMAKQIINNPTRIQNTHKDRIQKTDYKLTNKSIISYKGKDDELTFELENTKSLFTKKNRSGAKVFNFLLQKLNEQNYRETTHFSLSEIVENGIYKNKNTAYQGLKTILDTLYSISIEGITTEYQGKKKNEVRRAKARLISQQVVTWNLCSVSFPPIMREGMKFITILPSWSYSLSDNAFMLLDYVFIGARQNAGDIKSKGHFTMSMESIRIHLGLPTIEEAGKDPGKRIRNVIENAIEEIELARDKDEQEHPPEDADASDHSLLLTPIFDYGKDSVKEYLKGYLKVELDEPTQEYMNQRAIAHEKKLKGIKKEALNDPINQ